MRTRYITNLAITVAPTAGLSKFAFGWSEPTVIGLSVIAAFFTIVFTAITDPRMR